MPMNDTSFMESYKPGNNFLNPKAHKPGQNYPGRQISTGCASFTKELSTLTAIKLDKVKLPYICKDLNNLLCKIVNRDSINKEKTDVLLVSFEIVTCFPVYIEQ